MKRIIIVTALSTFLFTSCKKDQVITSEYEGKTTLTFDSRVGSSDFTLNTDVTIGTRTYNFSRLRYWISNVSLVSTQGTEYAIPKSYYLLEETGSIVLTDLSNAITYPATKRENVEIANIPVGDYNAIKFSVGVDSVHNNNMSLQAGELSQYNGMTNVSWMWLSSYIFTTLQGTVKDGATTKTIKAETGLNTNYKSVSLTLPEAIHVSSMKQKGVVINFDVAKIVDNIDLVTTPNVGASQATVMAALANNYTKAFSVTSVKQ